MKTFLLLIGIIGMGVAVPIVAIINAFHSIDKISPWGWAAVTGISIVAIASSVGIYVVGVSNPSREKPPVR